MTQTITLAAGCFWGVEAYYQKLKGVVDTEVGYANGTTANPTYEDVCKGDTNFAEVVRVTFDPKIIALDAILEHFYRMIDPTSLNKQGNDIGTQYRTGIFYEDTQDLEAIHRVTAQKQALIAQPFVVEILPLENYFNAEGYHQDYLLKNPSGYCHIDFSTIQPHEKKDA